MLFIFVIFCLFQYAHTCMSTVPGDGTAPCQNCPPLYDVKLCEGIAGCTPVPEANAVVYNYGACTTATLKYTADSQLKVKGADPFDKTLSSQAAAVGKLTCTADSKWYFDYFIGNSIIESLIYYTTDCIPCTAATLTTKIGVLDADICTNEVTCLPGTGAPTFTDSTEFCSTAKIVCPPGADVMVADVRGQATVIPLTALDAGGAARLICKTGTMAIDSDQTIAMGDITKITCATRNPCSNCDIINYLQPFCQPKITNEIKPVEATVDGCTQWTFEPINDTKLVWTFMIAGEANERTIMGQAAIDAITGAFARCTNDEIFITIPSQNIDKLKLDDFSMKMCTM